MAKSVTRTSRLVKAALLLAVVLLVVISAALAVPPADRGNPNRGQQAKPARSSEGEKKANPARKCKAERATMGADAFTERYGTNANKQNAFGKCVSAYAREQATKKK